MAKLKKILNDIENVDDLRTALSSMGIFIDFTGTSVVIYVQNGSDNISFQLPFSYMQGQPQKLISSYHQGNILCTIEDILLNVYERYISNQQVPQARVFAQILEEGNVLNGDVTQKMPSLFFDVAFRNHVKEKYGCGAELVIMPNTTCVNFYMNVFGGESELYTHMTKPVVKSNDVYYDKTILEIAKDIVDNTYKRVFVYESYEANKDDSESSSG